MIILKIRNLRIFFCNLFECIVKLFNERKQHILRGNINEKDKTYDIDDDAIYKYIFKCLFKRSCTAREYECI